MRTSSPPDRPPLLQLDRLTKRYGTRLAADAVSISVAAGEVVAFLGPNGAGKSTTMRMACGVLEPDSGDARICGHSILRERQAAQSKLGYLPEGAPLYQDMTPPAFLRFIASARGLDPAAAPRLIESAIADARIGQVLSVPVRALSKGYRRRVALAGAILHDPEVLVLDEPTDGLDPNQKQAVRALVSRMSAHKAILISTHLLDEVEAMCGRVVLLDRGRVIADTTPEALAGDVGLETAFRRLTQSEPSMEPAR